MGRKDFDNLIKLLRIVLAPTDTTVTSVEVDFELPRGFIAKISKIIFTTFPFTVTGADQTQSFQAALLRDPDDAATVVVPTNQVQHDVVAHSRGAFVQDFTTSGAGAWISEKKQINFREDEDVVTARNMRFNVQQGATDPDLNFDCDIYYTLEKVTDVDILALLDIL